MQGKLSLDKLAGAVPIYVKTMRGWRCKSTSSNAEVCCQVLVGGMFRIHTTVNQRHVSMHVLVGEPKTCGGEAEHIQLGYTCIRAQFGGLCPQPATFCLTTLRFAFRLHTYAALLICSHVNSSLDQV